MFGPGRMGMRGTEAGMYGDGGVGAGGYLGMG